MLDFHVDEGLGGHNGLEAIADMALQTRFSRPILCGHAVSLMDRSAVDLARIADKLAQADITVCALPTTNLYLQNRGGCTPTDAASPVCANLRRPVSGSSSARTMWPMPSVRWGITTRWRHCIWAC